MRSTKLRAAVAAAAALLAIAPAAALAGPLRHGRHRSLTGCTVNLNVAPRLLTAGEAALAYGNLACAVPTSDAGQTVTLYAHTEGLPGFTAVGTATTDEHGFYSLSTGTVQYNTAFYTVADEARSRRQPVRVSTQVTLVGPAETKQIFTGRDGRQTFTGTVNPLDVGATVVLQRQNAVTGNEWHGIQLSKVLPGGAFSITHTFVVPGNANIRVLVRGTRRNIAGMSNVLNYQISQTQNPNLTINTSEDPITDGSPVTISGKLAGGNDTIVTLLSHTAKLGRFAPVAEVKTNSSGEYTFPAQSPVNNTFYKVKSSTESSSVLYEAVKDVLTAEAAPTTLPAGQTVTFSGAVTPDLFNHVIYLERQNASATGFHVVSVGVITEASTYTIPYTVYSVGTDVFRIKIPGDGLNGGAISKLFTITVTAPTSAVTLPPESPTNTKHPEEGTV